MGVPSLPRVGLHDGLRGVVRTACDLRDADGGAGDGQRDGGGEPRAESLGEAGPSLGPGADDGRGDESRGAAQNALPDGLHAGG